MAVVEDKKQKTAAMEFGEQSLRVLQYFTDRDLFHYLQDDCSKEKNCCQTDRNHL